MIQMNIRTKQKQTHRQKTNSWGFPGGPVVKNLPSDAGDRDKVGVWD